MYRINKSEPNKYIEVSFMPIQESPSLLDLTVSREKKLKYRVKKWNFTLLNIALSVSCVAIATAIVQSNLRTTPLIGPPLPTDHQNPDRRILMGFKPL